MATNKEVDPKTIEEVGNTPAKEFVTDEMVEAAEESAVARNKKAQEKPDSGVGRLRTQGGGRVGGRTIELSDVPYPEGIHGEDYELYGPSGAAALIPAGTDIAPYASEQEYILVEEKVKHLSFDRPGRNLPKKRLYNVKAIHKDGRLVQLPFEAQVQNNAGGDPEDAIGLRRYQRKGIHLLIDWDTLIPIYCSAWDCWARAAQDGNHVAFCALRHAQHTLPNQYKGAGEISTGLMEAGVTTSNVWGS